MKQLHQSKLAVPRRENGVTSRRGFAAGAVRLAALAAVAALPRPAHAAVSESDAASGIRAALERGAATAVAALGRPDGFLGNPKVRIPLPSFLADASGLLRALGQQRRLEELETAMNRAAESAVPEAKTLLVQAVRSMSVEDARRILGGGDDAATRFFADKTRAPLTQRFMPIVSRATERVALAQKYDAIASKASTLGLVRAEQASLPQYVTGKSLDGLFLMIGEEERRIRQDPVASGSALLKRVFGGLR